VRAMGAAIEKAVCLALELQRRSYSIGILTGTTEVVDDVIPDDNVFSLNIIRGNGRIWSWIVKQDDNLLLNFEFESNGLCDWCWVFRLQILYDGEVWD
jgi:hypothetical protein